MIKTVSQTIAARNHKGQEASRCSRTSRAIVLVYLSLLPSIALADQTSSNPPSTTDLSVMLAKQCGELKITKDPDFAKVTCSVKTAASPTNEEVDACKAAVIKTASAAFTEDVNAQLDVQTAAILKTVEGQSRIVQRLHPALVKRKKSLDDRITAATSKQLVSFAIPAGTDPLQKRAIAAASEAKTVQDLKDAAVAALFDACIENDASIIEAVVPKLLTPAEEAASSKRSAEQAISEAERDAYAEFTKAEGFTRSVECIWASGADGVPKLACKPGLLVSGEQISEIHIQGLPANSSVTAISSDQFRQSLLCTNDEDLSCDHLTFPLPLGTSPVVITVHTTRNLFPTWGTRLGFSMKDARKILRNGNANRAKLSLVTSGTAATINISASDGVHEASTSVPVGFARWKIESGGFLSMSKLVDDELVTSAAEAGKVAVTGVRRTDTYGQDSGIFVNFVPQNYQTLGATLGFATPPNRRASIYLGPSVRVRTFGDRGLASLAIGLTMRSVLRFPDIVTANGEKPSDTNPVIVNTDSAALKGKEQYHTGLFIAVNLGFRIGSFGPAEGEK